MAGQKCLRDNEPVLRRRKQAFSIPQTHHVRRKIHDGRIKLPGHCHADRHFAQSVHVAPLNALHQFTCAIGWLPRNMAWRTKRRRKQTNNVNQTESILFRLAPKCRIQPTCQCPRTALCPRHIFRNCVFLPLLYCSYEIAYSGKCHPLESNRPGSRTSQACADVRSRRRSRSAQPLQLTLTPPNPPHRQRTSARRPHSGRGQDRV